MFQRVRFPGKRAIDFTQLLVAHRQVVLRDGIIDPESRPGNLGRLLKIAGSLVVPVLVKANHAQIDQEGGFAIGGVNTAGSLEARLENALGIVMTPAQQETGALYGIDFDQDIVRAGGHSIVPGLLEQMVAFMSVPDDGLGLALQHLLSRGKGREFRRLGDRFA